LTPGKTKTRNAKPQNNFIGGTGVTPVVSGVAPETSGRRTTALSLSANRQFTFPDAIRRDAELDRRDACATQTKGKSMSETPIIEIRNLSRRYGKLDAVNSLSLTVRAGKCYGFFGRNGAGKTTTIKCLLNLLRPDSGSARVFGLDPQKNEVAVKSRLAYVPDMVAFYPWMTVRDTLEYLASFRKHWNGGIETDLISRFHLDPKQKTSHLSKGQRTQLALIGAICPEPELLVLDEPTSGLDPIIRREFIETVIGAYQSGDPGRRTVFVSTHLISEFEGLIDEFTIIEQGRNLLTMEADAARDRFRKIRARFAQPPEQLDLPGALNVKQSDREVEILTNGNSEQLLENLKARSPEELHCESLSLEEIFVASDILKKVKA
jgi:ABC-2 type transport system ATP-binding protein